jgi:hypothetical protein
MLVRVGATALGMEFVTTDGVRRDSVLVGGRCKN